MLDHREDIESDFRVFHPYLFATDPNRSAEDILDGPRFFELAERLPHYRGALRDHVTEEELDRQEGNLPAEVTPAPRRSAPRQPGPTPAKVVTASPGVTEVSPLAGLIDWKTE